MYTYIHTVKISNFRGDYFQKLNKETLLFNSILPNDVFPFPRLRSFHFLVIGYNILYALLKNLKIIRQYAMV